ncbi:DUF2285 domain-containing protein [Reyranella sp.]|jgi:hypothetical protein|uniref:DUF2285 domain-containing protein n=1 Tax=Reyranella sp. TaxID=1929291 RepID=UPI00261BA4A1|nr:DUF2285 domain-containing protein [Reyranella sp.]HQS44816.1 DUF2285 domain-containing protein [Xanthobacteraceae bacterium]
MRRIGGYDFFENPKHDARDALPFWRPDPDIALPIVPDEDPETVAPVFDLWTFPGRKTIGHDGGRLALKLTRRGRSWHVHIAGALDATMPFTFAIAPDDRADARLREAKELLAVIATRPAGFTGQRGATEPIITMQSLQALDGHLAGASEREIAIAIFGARIVKEKWHGDSELRARVRYLVHRGRALMNGGYRRFLWGATARRAGEYPMPAAAR